MSGDDSLGYKVELYVYDLSRGFAKAMSPALLGKQIEGLWHTSVVAYGREYFFGGEGIASCRPGQTVLGDPDRVEALGESQVPYQLFLEYIIGLGESSFKPDSYDLLRHNCNSFSNELSQFLCGSGIPNHILKLPDEFLDTPLGETLSSIAKNLELKSSETRSLNFGNLNNNLLNYLPTDAITRRHDDSPELEELNNAIEEVRQNTLILEDRRNSLNEKVSRRERKNKKKEKKEKKEKKKKSKSTDECVEDGGKKKKKKSQKYLDSLNDPNSPCHSGTQSGCHSRHNSEGDQTSGDLSGPQTQEQILPNALEEITRSLNALNSTCGSEVENSSSGEIVTSEANDGESHVAVFTDSLSAAIVPEPAEPEVTEEDSHVHWTQSIEENSCDPFEASSPRLSPEPETMSDSAIPEEERSGSPAPEPEPAPRVSPPAPEPEPEVEREPPIVFKEEVNVSSSAIGAGDDDGGGDGDDDDDDGAGAVGEWPSCMLSESCKSPLPPFPPVIPCSPSPHLCASWSNSSSGSYISRSSSSSSGVSESSYSSYSSSSSSCSSYSSTSSSSSSSTCSSTYSSFTSKSEDSDFNNNVSSGSGVSPSPTMSPKCDPTFSPRSSRSSSASSSCSDLSGSSGGSSSTSGLSFGSSYYMLYTVDQTPYNSDIPRPLATPQLLGEDEDQEGYACSRSQSMSTVYSDATMRTITPEPKYFEENTMAFRRLRGISRSTSLDSCTTTRTRRSLSQESSSTLRLDSRSRSRSKGPALLPVLPSILASSSSSLPYPSTKSEGRDSRAHSQPSSPRLSPVSPLSRAYSLESISSFLRRLPRAPSYTSSISTFHLGPSSSFNSSHASLRRNSDPSRDPERPPSTDSPVFFDNSRSSSQDSLLIYRPLPRYSRHHSHSPEPASSRPSSLQSNVLCYLGPARPYEPPQVYTDVLQQARTEFDGLVGCCADMLSPEEQQHMEELRAYIVEDDGSWALGENFPIFFARIFHDESIPELARSHLLRIMAAAALKDDVILMLHQDRKEHTIMNFANKIESLPPDQQESLALFFCNMFEHLSPSEWLLYISEWTQGGQQISNIRVTTKVAVNALLHPSPKVQEYGTAIMYNLGTKEVKTVVFDDVAPELAMAILQYFNNHPAEELVWRVTTALCRFCYASSEVPMLIKMIGPEPGVFKGMSPRIDTVIEEINVKLSRVRTF